MSDTNHFWIEGKFKRIDTRPGKNGKVFETLILDVEGNYPQVVPFRLWGRSANTAKSLQPGDVVRINGKLGGREWDGRVFGDNSADSIEVVGQQKLPTGKQSDGAVPEKDADGSDSVPF